MEWESGICGKIVKGSHKQTCDFAIQLTTLVEAAELTGYMCRVKRELDKEERYTQTLGTV